jgi:aryl-alcohol dehydrogenase-like predicted oxidoreductase
MAFDPDRMEMVTEILDAFTEAGGNAIDTAHIYGGGRCEQAVGLWLERRAQRSDVVILAKGAHHDKYGPRVNRQGITQDLMESLERLRTDYVDLYALHRDDPDQPVGAILEALNEHIEAGRILTIGASNWTHHRIEEANTYAAAHGLRGFTFSSPNLSLAKPNEPMWPGCVSIDAEAAAWYRSRQFPLLAWSSQAGGFFSGRFSPEQQDNADIVRVYYRQANWDRLRRAEKLAGEKGVSAIQIALVYVLSQPSPTCAIVGPQTLNELSSCLEATRLLLTDEEVQWLEGE